VTSVWTWIMAHQLFAGAVTALIYAHIVTALPTPDIHSGKVYNFIFTLLTSFVSIARAFSSNLPIAAAQAQGLAAARAADPITVGETVTVTAAPPDPLKVAPISTVESK